MVPLSTSNLKRFPYSSIPVWSTSPIGLPAFNNNISTVSPRERDIFDLANGFKNLRILDLSTNGISFIPDNAFQILPALERINLNYNPISHIGSRAFAVGSSARMSFSLEENELPTVGLPEDAFDGVRNGNQGLSFNLACNRMEYLEQKSFQSLLNQTNLLVMGWGYPCTGDEEVQRFECDERVDWLCDNEDSYSRKLSGYRCKNETGFGDIWEYCAERNITTTTLSY